MINDPDDVAREYATERGLNARASLYEQIDGEDVKELLVQTILAHRPTRVLEVGSGTGALAQRLIDAGIGDYTALDISERMVELARARGIAAAVGDVQSLPFADAEFDCVIASWMLYHVPDLDLGLSEIARVLQPGGSLIATTNSINHLGELWGLVGHERFGLPFTAENGRARLERHFAEVDAKPVEAWLTLEDHEAARSYLNATFTRAHLAERVPRLTEPLRIGARTCIFVATKRS